MTSEPPKEKLAGEDETIPHEREHDEATLAELERVSSQASIADLAVPSVGYVQAEATAAYAAVNGILAVLRDAQLIPRPPGPA